MDPFQICSGTSAITMEYDVTEREAVLVGHSRHQWVPVEDHGLPTAFEMCVCGATRTPKIP